jgi:hypothetical protein
MTSNPLGGFEEKLLRELRSVVARRKAEQAAKRSTRAPLWRRPRVVSVASAGALAIGAAIGLPLVGGETTAPPANAAYEVTANDDGTVTVTIYRFSDADGLEAKLDEHGVPADVAYTPAGKRCQPDRYQPAPKARPVRLEWGARSWTFTVRPSDFAADETLVIVHDRVGAMFPDDRRGAFFDGTVTDTAVGPVEECVLEDDPNDPMKPRRVDGHLTFMIPNIR